MAIYVITGKPRHGKTYLLSTFVPSWLKDAKKHGVKLYSNIKINYQKLGYKDDILGDIYSKEDRENPDKLLYYWRNIDTWNFMSKGVIVADEASRYFNPRKWALLSEETEIKLQQHGKEDLEIWTTTQHYSRLDITLRILVESFFNVEMIFGSANNQRSFFPKIIRITEHYLEDMERLERMGNSSEDDKAISRKFKIIRKKYARLYDTRELVIHSRPMPLRHTMRLCPECDFRSVSHA